MYHWFQKEGTAILPCPTILCSRVLPREGMPFFCVPRLTLHHALLRGTSSELGSAEWVSEMSKKNPQGWRGLGSRQHWFLHDLVWLLYFHSSTCKVNAQESWATQLPTTVLAECFMSGWTYGVHVPTSWVRREPLLWGGWFLQEPRVEANAERALESRLEVINQHSHRWVMVSEMF